MKKPAILLFFIFTLGAVGSFALTQSKTKQFKKSIEMGKAKEVKTDINFFSGELNISTSTNDLAECLYGYDDGFIRPKMTYSEIGSIGYLTIESEEQDKGIDESNHWDLKLNKNVKNELSVKLRAGKANIDLEGCKLRGFNYRMTAGESNINLRNTSVPQVSFNLLAGEANIDLSGEWNNDGVAEIKGGVGEITVSVPYNMGVKIIVTGMLGDVNIPFFHKVGNEYTNDSFGKSKHIIFLSISGGIGQINVKMAE